MSLFSINVRTVIYASPAAAYFLIMKVEVIYKLISQVADGEYESGFVLCFTDRETKGEERWCRMLDMTFLPW